MFINNSDSTQKKKRTYEESMALAKQRVEKVITEKEKTTAQTTSQLFLPGFDIGAMPNHLNRSSLIAPIARGTRKQHTDAVMVTRSDCVLTYSGQQLDEADGDLIMALIYFAQPQPLGTLVPLNRKELLRKIKNGAIGSTQYEWLHKAMKRLYESALFLEARKPDGSSRYTIGRTNAFRILKELEYNDALETYIFMMDPRWVQMFSNKEYGLLDFDKRLQIGRGQDMAKTLQRLLITSCDSVQRYKLEWLKVKMEYASPMRKFRDALMSAVHELVRLEIISSGKIEMSTKGNEQLTIRLQPVA